MEPASVAELLDADRRARRMAREYIVSNWAGASAATVSTKSAVRA